MSGNEDLLKEQIKQKYPKLRPSFSTKTFLTYVSDEQETLSNLEFALSFGINIGKYPTLEQAQSALNEKTDRHQIIKIKNDYWAGINMAKHDISQIKILDLPMGVPSRAFLKIAQALELINNTSTADQWIELGSSPGGASMYLAQNYKTVWGLDPGEMDKELDNFKNFEHIKKSIFDFKPTLEMKDVKWMAVDMNLPVESSINESLRLAKQLKNIKGIYFTLKMPKPTLVNKIPQYLKKFEVAGFRDITTLQLPAHRREFIAIALK